MFELNDKTTDTCIKAAVPRLKFAEATALRVPPSSNSGNKSPTWLKADSRSPNSWSAWESSCYLFSFQQIHNGAGTTMTLGNKRMDADSQARQLLDRMANDFDQMLKRSDISYYVKTGSAQPGNDQIAFFSAVPGYYGQAGYNSNASLVAYRVNADSTSASYNKLERMGKGLALNGAYTTGPDPTSVS